MAGQERLTAYSLFVYMYRAVSVSTRQVHSLNALGVLHVRRVVAYRYNMLLIGPGSTDIFLSDN